MNSTPPSVSFIVILDFSARWKYLTESVSDLLGWEPSDLREHSFFELVHPEELSQVQQLHYETILSDKAAAMVYMRLKHRDAHKGYLLCAVSRTVVHDRVVGSVSFASPGGEALHTSSTAQEITVITPAAANFEFRRWHDPPPAATIFPSPPRTSPVPRAALMRASNPPADLPATQSSRTALILDRFSVNCTVTYYSNYQIVSSAAATKRPFFDFVARQDEAVVRSWLGAIKTCGVNERGHPSSGGFGYGRFLFCTEGRDSMYACPESSFDTRLTTLKCVGASPARFWLAPEFESIARVESAYRKHRLRGCDFFGAFGWASLYSAIGAVVVYYLELQTNGQPKYYP